MSQPKSDSVLSSQFVQLTISLIIPTIVLMTLSDPTRLGPTGAMLLALAFPVALELYSLTRRRKPSLMSLASIGGILLIGLISLLGLNEYWLAARRSAVYAVGAIALFVVIKFKPALIEKGLDRVLEMEGIRSASRRNKTEAEMMRYIAKAGYILVGILMLTAVASYVLTIVFITAPTTSSQFNTQYAELRVLSIVVITVPLVVAVTGVLLYLVNRFEKLTGMSAEDFLKKKSPK